MNELRLELSAEKEREELYMRLGHGQHMVLEQAQRIAADIALALRDCGEAKVP